MNSTLIDRLNAIDIAWRGRQRPVISEVLRATQDRIEIEELGELLAADSEWRWRKVGFGSEHPATAGCDWGDPRPRSVETYLAEFPDLAESSDAIRMLVESEFMARSRWGNPPMITEFVERFPYLECLELSLRDNLDELSMVFVKRLAGPTNGHASNLEELAPLPVRTPLSIGRQSMKEPRDTFMMPERNRLIIVDNYQHGVSRQHAMMTRQAMDRCWIANISPFGEMKVNEQDFPPGSRVLALFPMLVEIGGVRLKFFSVK